MYLKNRLYNYKTKHSDLTINIDFNYVNKKFIHLSDKITSKHVWWRQSNIMWTEFKLLQYTWLNEILE